jgi:thiol-disulfide isomerase/thioredoxin
MRFPVVLLVAALMALAGCGSATTTDDGGSAAEASTSAGSGEQKQAEKKQGGSGATPAALDFTGTTLAGDTFQGADLAGKPAVLWFWAPWCPTCRAQIPNLTELAEKHEGEVEVVGVGGLAAEDQIAEMADSIPHLTHLVDGKGTVWNHFEVTAQSSYEVIDADGKIVHSGYLDDGALNDLVADLAG